ncbi:PREDICTED: importin subunit beta-1 isoform X2 [Amphimedon queenslandica]|uniref:Importin N-terminal domain-containing protein n=1 Tax=Amphimedon queenslandica TaxID=400682 RepID=A0A1X7UJC0_AMPQE|nr:PREDICTED: importin subunit beta-1 isoform X2 [Amphimedon queenslandica]|eukprot:XP_019853838.1 PREDICTED: importin subunit beta-1 isoform X2 [Amphimedon queenslandica]
MNLTPILEATVSSSTADIQQAEKFLEQAASQDLCQFLKLLATELADVSKSVVSRMAAGLQLKNYLTSKDPDFKLQYQQRWLSFPLDERQGIKHLVMQSLGTETTKPTAPQVIAYIASAELPSGAWPEVIATLAFNVTSTQSSESLKIASLDSIGYICEEISPKVLSGASNEILTAIVQGMRKEEPSLHVRLAATKALYNSLEFTKSNFDKETERHFIMQVVCEATQCPNEEVVIAALQNLVKIMSLYYSYMEAYMGPALFAITLEAMQSSIDGVVLQAIEFWSTVCDEEQDLAIEAMEASETGRPPSQTSFHYVRGALHFLLPILLRILAKQEEYDDEDDWVPSKAAGVCLSLMASCTEDSIVPLVIPFVKENIFNGDWRFRDAAVMALGCIMEGPDPDQLAQFISEVLLRIIELMKSDPLIQVKDSAAWTIGRICEQVPSTVLHLEVLSHLLPALIDGLKRETRVATNICWAFSSLAEAACDSALQACSTDDVETYALSSSFEQIVSTILATAERNDAVHSNLRTAAYEALMDLIKYSPKDCYIVVQKTVLHVLDSLQKVVQIDENLLQGHDKQQVSDLESLLCATLQSLLRKMTKEDVLQISDSLVQALIAMLSTSSGLVGGVQEDAILTIGALVESLGVDFLKYMPSLSNYLIAALKNYNDVQVCQAAIGLVGDLCRSLSVNLIPYCENIMQIMVDTLSNPTVHRSIKPPILSTIGDIALAIGSQFMIYCAPVLGILEQASRTQSENSSDLDMLDYLNELREGCLEGYTGIVQGLKGDKENEVSSDIQLIVPHLPWILAFIEIIGNEQEKTDSVIAGAAGLLGDLLNCFGAQLIPIITQKPAITKLLSEGRQSRNKRTKTLATWSMKTIKQLQGESPGSKCG